MGINSIEPFFNMPSTHAEIDALNKIRKKRELPNIVDIVVIRITKTGVLGQSRPCYHCIDALNRSRLNIKDLYYSTNTGNIAYERFTKMRLSNNTHISRGIRVRLLKKNKINNKK